MDTKCMITSNSEFGRYVIARKSIKAGEILFEETPFAFGPKQDSPVVCLGCSCLLSGISKPGQRCTKCGWPLCSDCENNNNYEIHKKECEIFSKNSVAFQNSESLNERCIQLDCVTPLRVLLQKDINPERWESEVVIMEDHEKERRETQTWEADNINIVKYLHGPCGLKDRYPEELIQKILGILEVNAFEAKTINGSSIRCLYPKLAILAHSCVPNTAHNIFPTNNYNCKVRATVDVNEGEMLNSCYTHTLEGTTTRQIHLKEGKFFTCRCKRCLDPTELGTHFSSLKCSKCDPGLILSTNPLDNKAEWKCSHCLFKTSSAAVQKAIDVMKAEITEIQMLDFSQEKLQKCEHLYKKYRSILHPKHFIQINLKQSLIELYGRVEGYEMEQLPDIMLEHKIDMCQDVLKVLEIVEPGKTRSRALMLFEIHVPMILLMKSEFSNGILAGENMKKRIKDIIDILNECVEILNWEDLNSAEGFVCQMAQGAVEQLSSSLNHFNLQ